MAKSKITLALKCIPPEFIGHVSRASWGDSIVIMEKQGKAFARLYCFNDDSKNVYLDWLSVNVRSRRKGLGKKLQEIREEMGRVMGAKVSNLWVRKDSWMFEWYKKRGYVEGVEYEDEDNCVWMSKNLS